VTTREQSPGGRPSALISGVVRTDGARAEADALRHLEARVADLEAELNRPGADQRQKSSLLAPRQVFSVLGMVAVVVGGLFVGYLAWKGITLVLIAVLFALALNPAVEFFVARGCSRATAAALVFVLALGLLGLLGLLLIPPLVDQVTSFANALPHIISSADQGHGPLGSIERRFHLLDHVSQTISGRGGQGVGGVATSGVGVVLGVLGTAASIVIIAFLAFFMLLEGPAWIRRLDQLLPEATRPRWERVTYGIYRTVGGFVSGNLVASLLAGLSTTAVLMATGISFAVPLGLLVAFLDLLPVFGMIVALLVMAAVSFSHSLVAGIVVVGFLFLYHQLEVYFLRPLIYGRTIELSPLAVLVAVVIGTELAGVIGALAAIPVAGAANVVVCELLRARVDARRQEILEPTL
jgi:predicted PurR-regulated permease PerM